MSMRVPAARVLLAIAVWAWAASSALPQAFPPPKPAEAIKKLGPNQYAIGSIRIDTAKRELMVPGKVNPVQLLEFVACTRDGMKAYESAITVDAYAINFNAALLLIGLDASHGRVPTRHFDPSIPQGDPVEIWVEGQANGKSFRIPAEQLMFDQVKKTAVSGSSWVYTGSTFIPSDTTPRFMAEEDGVLIGFVHSPAPLIEQVVGSGVARYGAIVLNPNLGFTPDMPITLTVKALATSPAKP
jgi:hypothetical protein